MLNKIYSNLKIKHKLFAVLILEAFALGIIGLMAVQFSLSIYNYELYSQVAEVLNLYSKDVEGKIKDISELSYNIITNKQVQDYLDIIKNSNKPYEVFDARSELNNRLCSWALYENYILSISIIDTSDNQLVNGINTKTFDKEQKDSIVNKCQQKKGAITWFNPTFKDSSLIMGRQIRKIPELSLDDLGTLVIRIDPNKLVSRHTKKHNSKISIISKNSIIFQENNTIKSINIRILLDSEKDFDIKKIQGKKYLITKRFSSYTEWFFINMLPYENIFYNINIMKLIMTVIFLLVFLFSIFFAMHLALEIAGPIDNLSKKMKIEEIGDLENLKLVDTNIYNMNDEIAKLDRDFTFMVKKIKELIEENYVKQIMIKDSQYKALQAQINPHFLYNTLDSINWMAKLVKQPQIATMVKSLGNLLRNSISKKSYMITIKEEMEILHDYITIQKIRYEDRLDFKMNISEELTEFFIPKLSLQPIVENSITYGLESMVETCIIAITAKALDNTIVITVIDNGPGVKHDILEKLKNSQINPKGSGIGLKNIDARIKTIFGEDYGICISNNPDGGTIVKVNIGYKKGYEDV